MPHSVCHFLALILPPFFEKRNLFSELFSVWTQGAPGLYLHRTYSLVGTLLVVSQPLSYYYLNRMRVMGEQWLVLWCPDCCEIEMANKIRRGGAKARSAFRSRFFARKSTPAAVLACKVLYLMRYYVKPFDDGRRVAWLWGCGGARRGLHAKQTQTTTGADKIKNFTF